MRKPCCEKWESIVLEGFVAYRSKPPHYFVELIKLRRPKDLFTIMDLHYCPFCGKKIVVKK